MRKSKVILPCGVSSAPNRPSPGRTNVTSVVTTPLRKLRASSPPTLTTPRSGRKAAFIAWAFLKSCLWSEVNRGNAAVKTQGLETQGLETQGLETQGSKIHGLGKRWLRISHRNVRR